ncbi:MAG: shikimate kinase [Nitrospirota bacterium]
MKNIVLTGFMGTGKTEIGKELSGRLGMRLVDVDTEIEKSRNKTISEIFREYGEQTFREIETEMIRTIARRSNVIISTGGGAVLKQENMDLLRENGIVVCLMASPETILKRTEGNTARPLLQGKDPLGTIKDLLNFRKPFYENADIVVDTEDKTPLRIAEEILYKIQDSEV